MVRAALLNLLLNACEAAGEGPVFVQQRQGGTYIEIVVSDSGPGLAAEVREQLFEPFVTTKPGGTGLGLPIARRFARAQGGELTLQPNARGGTDAILRLPTTATTEATAEALDLV